MNEKEIVVPNLLKESGVEKMIQVVRGKQVLLDRDLATLYGVETKRINEQVKRNIERFPEDFCKQLSLEESQLLRSQNATLEKKGQNLKGKHTKYRSLAFTEQGVAMLSSVLKSESAIKVNIAIMRAFVQLRHLMMGNGGLVNRLSNVEAKDLEQIDEFVCQGGGGDLNFPVISQHNGIHQVHPNGDHTL